MQSPGRPRRTTVVRAASSTGRSMRVSAMMAGGSRLRRNGTRVTRSQLRMKSRRRCSAAKPLARMPVHMPNTPRPQIMTMPAIRRPRNDLRHRIAVAGRRQRRHRPPQRQRQAAEALRLPAAFENVERGAGEQQHDEKDDEHARQRPRFERDHAAEQRKSRNQRRQLEQPQRGEQPGRVGRNAGQQGNRNGHHGKDVDHAGGGEQVVRLAFVARSRPALDRQFAGEDGQGKSRA